MSAIRIGDCIKGRVVEEINGDRIVARDKIFGKRYHLHEIKTYKDRKHFLVINWEGHLFEVEDIK